MSKPNVWGWITTVISIPVIAVSLLTLGIRTENPADFHLWVTLPLGLFLAAVLLAGIVLDTRDRGSDRAV